MQWAYRSRAGAAGNRDVHGLRNEQRLHSAIGYMTPRVRLEGMHVGIQTERDRKIEDARKRRRKRFEIAEISVTVKKTGEAEAVSAETQPAEE